MSAIEHINADPVTEAAVSLEDRMRAAAEASEDITTEDFPVPGWASFAWVRLKVIGHQLQRKQVEKNRRVRDRGTMELYIAADTIMAATDGFYEVEPTDGDGDETLTPVETSWLRLGKGVFRLPDGTTPRVAFIRLIGSERVMGFYAEYIEWLNSERTRIGAELTEDFPATP